MIISTIESEGFDSPVKVHGCTKASLFYLLVVNFKVHGKWGDGHKEGC